MPQGASGLFVRALLLGALAGAIFGLVLWAKEQDRRKRIYWSMKFWLMVTAGLAVLGLVETWVARW